MDPLSITAAALVVKALEEFATEAGKGTWGLLGKLVETVRAKFAGDDPACEALAEVQDAPADTDRAQALARHLDRHASEDDRFRAALADLVGQAERDPAIGRFVTRISGSARVGKVVNIQSVHGDVSF